MMVAPIQSLECSLILRRLCSLASEFRDVRAAKDIQIWR